MEMLVKVVNKKAKIIIIIAVLIIGCLGALRFFTKEDKNTSLTIIEKKWIENNKNKVIDLSVLNNIPIINDNGNGIFFDFLNSLESDTGLEFNKLSYENGEKPSSDYALKKTDTVSDKDILIYEDNYSLITKNKTHYNNVSEIKNITVGVLNKDLTKISKALLGSSVTYKGYETNEEILTALNNGDIDTATLPKLEYLDKILSSKNLNIAYNITEYKVNYVLTLGQDEKLNKILTKYLNKWKQTKYQKSLNNHITDTYFTYKKIDEKEQTKFRSKRYTYGFVTNSPFDTKINNRLKGFNYSVVNNFEKMASVEIDYKQYSSIDSLVKDFNENKLDLIFDNISISKFAMDTYKTVPIYESKIAIITNENTNFVVNNVTSLMGKTILTVANTKINQYLKSQGIATKEYNNVQDLIKNMKKSDLAAVDEYSYDYYARSNLKEYKKLQIIDFNEDYGYLSRKINDNTTFNEFFDFYLSFINPKQVINNSYKNLLLSNNSNEILQIILSTIAIVLIASLTFFTKNIFSKKRHINSKLSKADKLRYVDALTSLKNRNYLNDNINDWDNSQIYPQSIIIVDLNNISYINDNFGHIEGDKVIVEAAGTLINNQLSDSELLRTNGNEFLIFVVGHDEKTIVTYIRKLNKEFKELSHGFGAAIGYSMINDEIKSIDDAINEATTDMRNNKEEINH
jgi:diguanylate cyclase (GGDEF)-like protein